jgi:PAS domain S-box-containing protein/diguanylate cyclase (GGDEF)-like protein
MPHTNRAPLVLIVDDQESSRQTMRALLGQEECRLEFASNGRQGIQMAQTLLPDLVLLDVMMPDMTGFDVCEHLRQDPHLSSVPIIMVTALDDRDSISMGMNAGADDFITKPFDRILLRARVRNIIRLNRFRSLGEERNKFSQLTELSPDGILLLEQHGQIQFANRAVVEMLEVPKEHLLQSSLFDFLPPSLHKRYQRYVDALVRGDDAVKRFEFCVRSSAALRWLECSMGAYEWQDAISVQLVMWDITERKAQEEIVERFTQQQSIISFLGRRALEAESLDMVFEETTTIVRNTLNVDGACLLRHDMFDGSDVLSPISAAPASFLSSTAKVETSIGYDLGFVLRQGAPVTVSNAATELRFRMSPIFEEMGVRSALFLPLGNPPHRWGVLCVFRQQVGAFLEHQINFVQSVSAILTSVIQKEETQRQLHYELSHDSVTGLPNRQVFENTLQEAIELSEGVEQEAAVAVFRLTNLRTVRTALGYRLSGRIRRTVGQMIRELVPASCEVAFIGGTQFGVFVPGVSRAEELEALFAPIIERLKQPIEVDQVPIHLYITCGVSLVPVHGPTPTSLIRRADIASEQAIDLGEWFAIYSSDLDKSTPYSLTLAAEIHKGINEREFFLEFQPKMDLATGKIIGAEALVRWMHPKRGRLSPFFFIDLAEQTALIRPLTYLVIEEALQALQKLDVPEGFRLAVNLSPSTLYEPAFLPSLEGLFAQCDSLPNQLTFEITETAVMTRFDQALKTIEALREKGIKVSVDDFGTGYSSLTYLSTLPIDEVKLDRAFISQVQDERVRSIVQAVIQMSNSLSLEIVAEGIEDEASGQLLHEMGCQIGQGYVYSKPLPFDAFVSFLSAHR